jgi:tight adherence protein B
LRAPAVVLWVRERARRRREEDQREADVAEVCVALSAELKSGVPVGHALAAVGRDWPDLLGSAAARAAIGGDVVTALRDEASRPGAGALEAIAASWEVSARTGAPLSRVLMAVADSLRMAATVRREAESQLATAKTTARLMAVLPFGTLLLMSSDGAAVEFLLTTPYGLVCLAGAGGFIAMGLWWVRRVTRSVLRPAWEP